MSGRLTLSVTSSFSFSVKPFEPLSSHMLMWCVVQFYFLLPNAKTLKYQRRKVSLIINDREQRCKHTNSIINTVKGSVCTGCVQNCYLYRKQNYYLSNVSYTTHTHVHTCTITHTHTCTRSLCRLNNSGFSSRKFHFYSLIWFTGIQKMLNWVHGNTHQWDASKFKVFK